MKCKPMILQGYGMRKICFRKLGWHSKRAKVQKVAAYFSRVISLRFLAEIAKFEIQ